MVEAALSAEIEGVRRVWGISANRDSWWDLEAGRAIGYQPEDDASTFAAPAARPEDEAEGARVGGPFATPALARRPFDEEA